MVANAFYQLNNPIYRKHKLSFISLAIITLVAFSSVGCGKKDDVASAPQMAPMPVTVITMEPTSVPISAEAVAQTEGAKEVEIRPRVGGIIFKKLFEEGANINAGQAMFLIDPAPFQIALANAKAQLAQQRARVEQTQRESQRLQGLLATQSISEREADNANSDNALARAALAQYEANVREAELNLSYTTVTSPISGVAGRFEVSEGALVSANSSLLTTVSQINPIWVRFSFSDNELAALGGRLTKDNVKEVTLILPNGKEFPKKGKLNFAASSIDPQLGTQQLRAAFENGDRTLLPGQFGRIRVTTGQQDGVYVVPQTSVINNDQGKFVYVADANNQVAIKPIVTGNWVGENWVVMSGLNAGDKVITDNIIKLRPGSPVSPHAPGTAPGAPNGAAPANGKQPPAKPEATKTQTPANKA
jgi:membrane fusion protein (multidrug efflux system)